MKKIFLIISCALSLLMHAEALNSSEFMKGYLFSKLEDKYHREIEVSVVGDEIILCNLPGDINAAEIKLFLEECCPSFHVQMGNASSICETDDLDTYLLEEVSQEEVSMEDSCEEHLLPELNPFFPTMLAQPHMFGYSVGYRSYDKVFKSSIPVSIGDQFSLFQIKSLSYGQLYFGVEVCVWAVFDARTKSLSLINADYFIGLPFTYINDRFSARLRVFHQSSHLGDEFLLENPKIERFNPSMEVLDLSLAYEPIDRLQLFLGFSTVLRSDDDFKVKPNSVYYGLNYMLDCAKIRIFNVESLPYMAAYFTNEENTSWALDSSFVIGYQWEKSYGRKLRIYLMGHDGYSDEGQFAKRRSKYVSLNLMYGY